MKKKPRKARGWRPDRDAAVFAVIHELRGQSPGDLARATGMSPATFRKWRKPPRDGGTRYPQHISLERALSAVGKKFTIVDKDDPS